jgi:hypothetical protein
MAEPTLQFGADAKLYYDSSSPSPNWASPTWVELSGVAEDDGVKAEFDWEKAETYRRANGRVKTSNKTRVGVKVSWKMMEIENDAGFLAMRAAAMDPTGIYQLLICSGAFGVSGHQYLRADFQITAKQGQPNNGVNTWEFEAEPCASVNLCTTGVTPIGSGGLG